MSENQAKEAAEEIVRLPLNFKFSERVDAIAAIIARHFASHAADVRRLRDALRQITQMTDADDGKSYRCDDREGCLDAVHAAALSALTPAATAEQKESRQ